jgi:hypothetical protein
MDSKDDVAKLTAECERLRKIRHELRVQSVTVDQRLAEIEFKLQIHDLDSKDAKGE